MIVGIVGANGFVGHYLTKTFLNANERVYAIYNNSNQKIPIEAEKVHITLAHTIKYDIIYIAIGSHASSYEQYVNHFVFLNDILRNWNFNRIIFISSVEVYGKHKGIITKSSCFNNPSQYGTAKICQEFLIKSANHYTIVRPTYIYGEGMNDDSLIPMWLNKAQTEKKIRVFGEGLRSQDYLHVEDLCKLCTLLPERQENEIIIAATGHSIANRRIAETIAGAFKDVIIEFCGSDDTMSTYFDVSETQRLLGWYPQLSVSEWLKAKGVP
jgi:UDP-glucose 4-epimerase